MLSCSGMYTVANAQMFRNVHCCKWSDVQECTLGCNMHCSMLIFGVADADPGWHPNTCLGQHWCDLQHDSWIWVALFSAADPGSGIQWFLTPGSGIQEAKKLDPDPGDTSKIRNTACYKDDNKICTNYMHLRGNHTAYSILYTWSIRHWY